MSTLPDIGEMFDHHAEDIYRYLVRRVGVSPVEELLSRTFLTAVEKAGRFNPSRGSARAWLFGIAVSSAVDDSGVVYEVILDPDTDAYLGSRDVVVEAGSEDIFPPGTVRSQTAVTTDVVQDAP